MKEGALLKPAASPGKKAAIVLAVLVHLALAIFLFYGVRWQSRPVAPVEVDIVRSEPSPAPAAPVAEPPVEAKVEPPPEPKVEPKVEPPKPAPLPEVKPPPKPDIVSKVKPKPKPEPKPVKETAPKSLYDPRQLAEEIKQTAERKSAAAIAQDQAQLQAAAAAATRSRTAQAWREKIAAKIKGNIVRPGNAGGNPEAVFEVVLLPDGSLVGEPQLRKSTGNTALDDAIVRAIKKSDPLPKPDDPSVFERALRLTFRPLED